MKRKGVRRDAGSEGSVEQSHEEAYDLDERAKDREVHSHQEVRW